MDILGPDFDRRCDGDPKVTAQVWQPEAKTHLSEAVARLEDELPDWWWTTGSCSVSAHASIGPDRNGKDKGLLAMKTFDDGFHADLKRPSTCGEALNACIDEAIEYLNSFHR